ncbi:hypothetical protein MNBD_IGNAVI01-459 [hydrothermal vent metagenome]|uniref:ATP-grasp domain-containing protein n=1 Tax=hydrothermal vent metagenome TaxID=652676 RepID=A0A3B1CS20_9ZZZZ
MKRIAFVKDNTKLWTVWAPIFEQKGYNVVLLNTFSKTDQDRLLTEHWDAFIWRAKHDPWIKNLAKRFLSFFDIQQKIKTFPSFHDYLHYDDKITQYYILKSKSIPTPETYIYFDKNEAFQFLESANFPVVYKASSGSGSGNVGLIKSKLQGKIFIQKAFGKGVKAFFREEPIHRYCYFQEFLRGNKGDYKIVCFGDRRITGFIRIKGEEEKDLSLPRDKHYKYDIPIDLLEFVSSVHRKLGSLPVMSYDILKNNEGEWVVTELGVIFGDINNWHYYTDSKIYERNSEGIFTELEKSELSNDELFIELLLKKWGWVD